MSIFQALVYGFVQGITEFLPVSSSAHLTLIPFFTGWPDPGLAFDVALHWGTLLAVLLYFRREVMALIGLFIESLKGQRSADHALPWKIALATVPGAIFGLLFEKQAETVFRSPALLVATLSLMGIALWAADRWAPKNLRLADLSWLRTAFIGIGQGFALIPGVSRSGITITTGLLAGLDRGDAVRFSFFLAMPITFGAGLMKSKYLFQHVTDPAILVAMVSSAIFGFMAIHVLITYVRKGSFTPFVIYRLALAAAIAVMLIYKP